MMGLVAAGALAALGMYFGAGLDHSVVSEPTTTAPVTTSNSPSTTAMAVPVITTTPTSVVPN